MAASGTNKKKALPYDSAEFLTEADVAEAYLTEALETDDPEFIAYAIGQVAKARGMTEIAKRAGVGRESLYKSLSGEKKPEFATILRVLAALGYTLRIKPAPKKAA